MIDTHWREIREILRLEREIIFLLRELLGKPTPTSIVFEETTMNPTEAGQSQVFTGTLTPSGSVFPSDSVFQVTSNDPSVAPTVDPTGLIVSVTYPSGWVEGTTPLVFDYTATSASTGMSLSAAITPSAPPAVVPTGITFAQTT